VAGWLLLRRRDRLPLVAALAVGLASTAAVVLSVYVRVPALGPLPELYEPVWYRDKAVSAIARPWPRPVRRRCSRYARRGGSRSLDGLIPDSRSAP
jgi:hypothetical protein